MRSQRVSSSVKLVLLLHLSGLAAFAQDTARVPSIEEITNRGRKTLERALAESVSWTATHDIPSGAQFVVQTLRVGEKSRIVMTVKVGAQQQELARIIQRDGLWYVTAGPQSGKYRPWEAPLAVPTAYLYLAQSDLLAISAPEDLVEWTCVGVQSNVATYRKPLPPHVQRMLRMSIRGLEELARADSKTDALSETQTKLIQTRELLERGLVMKVDVQSGVLLRSGNEQRQLSISELQWHESVSEKEFSVEGRRWQDFSSDPTLGNLNDWAMLGHNGMWRPGSPTGELDVRMIHLATGAVRRVPYQGGPALPGCFLRDRSSVVVVGTGSGGLGVFEVNLKTGANRQLGGDKLASGITLFPAVSREGKKLAVAHKDGTEAILQSRVAIIDLESSVTRFVGDPMDMGFLSWLPDGNELVLLRRETGGRDGTICRMDMDGRIIEIRSGNFPVLLQDGATILFVDEDRLWKTCNLQGEDVALVGDGLSGHGFPSPSPDGKRMLMMRFSEGKAPEPVVLPIGSSRGQGIPLMPGLWGYPTWR